MDGRADTSIPTLSVLWGLRVTWLCRIAIVLAIVGVFGTWRVQGSVSLTGVEGPHNGWLVVIFGLIALTGVGGLSRGSWTGVVAVLGSAAVMLFAAVANVVDDYDAVGGHAGWGVWLTVGAAAVLATCAVTTAVRLIRAHPRTRGVLARRPR